MALQGYAFLAILHQIIRVGVRIAVIHFGLSLDIEKGWRHWKEQDRREYKITEEQY